MADRVVTYKGPKDSGERRGRDLLVYRLQESGSGKKYTQPTSNFFYFRFAYFTKGMAQGAELGRDDRDRVVDVALQAVVRAADRVRLITPQPIPSKDQP